MYLVAWAANLQPYLFFCRQTDVLERVKSAFPLHHACFT
jgi:hypothetical protein